MAGAVTGTRFQNPKFVPVTFVDRTSGYELNTAVLFPETVSVGANKPANHFGAIFCDREAARLRAVATHAADVLSLNLAPDAAALLARAAVVAPGVRAVGPDRRALRTAAATCRSVCS